MCPSQRRRARLALGLVALGLGVTSLLAPAAEAAPRRAHVRTAVCAGSSARPGVLAGTYRGNVSVEGTCDVDAGIATVRGNLTVQPDSNLVARYARNDRSHRGASGLVVERDLLVRRGASALLGCEPEELPCLEASEPKSPLVGTVRVDGSLLEQEPLGVVMHHGVVRGSIVQVGGGGGGGCEPGGFFTTFKQPVYSDYEDSTIGGDLDISRLASCWLGIARDRVGGSVELIGDELSDPDAIEILSNTVAGDLSCQGDSNVWDSTDYTEALWPRRSEPNTVRGARGGQCLLASPPSEGAAPGPAAF